MKLYFIKLNSGLNGPELLCHIKTNQKSDFTAVPIMKVLSNPTENQLLLFNEEEKNIFTEFQMAGEDLVPKTLKGYTHSQWNEILNRYLGYFVCPRAFELL